MALFSEEVVHLSNDRIQLYPGSMVSKLWVESHVAYNMAQHLELGKKVIMPDVLRIVC